MVYSIKDAHMPVSWLSSLDLAVALCSSRYTILYGYILAMLDRYPEHLVTVFISESIARHPS